MHKQGAFNPNNTIPTQFYKNSKGGQRFDYSYRVLPKYLKKYGSSVEGTFFIPEGDGYAYNTFNFGNFLWGATGRANGYPLDTLQVGAHFNSLVNPRTNGYLPQLDSNDDQFSIKRGHDYALHNIGYLRSKYFAQDVMKSYKEFIKPYNKTNYIVN